MRLPIVKLTYENSGRTWANSKGKVWTLPEQATFDPNPNAVYYPLGLEIMSVSNLY